MMPLKSGEIMKLVVTIVFVLVAILDRSVFAADLSPATLCP